MILPAQIVFQIHMNPQRSHDTPHNPSSPIPPPCALLYSRCPSGRQHTARSMPRSQRITSGTVKIDAHGTSAHAVHAACTQHAACTLNAAHPNNAIHNHVHACVFRPWRRGGTRPPRQRSLAPRNRRARVAAMPYNDVSHAWLLILLWQSYLKPPVLPTGQRQIVPETPPGTP